VEKEAQEGRVPGAPLLASFARKLALSKQSAPKGVPLTANKDAGFSP